MQDRYTNTDTLASTARTHTQTHRQTHTPMLASTDADSHTHTLTLNQTIDNRCMSYTDLIT